MHSTAQAAAGTSCCYMSMHSHMGSCCIVVILDNSCIGPMPRVAAPQPHFAAQVISYPQTHSPGTIHELTPFGHAVSRLTCTNPRNRQRVKQIVLPRRIKETVSRKLRRARRAVWIRIKGPPDRAVRCVDAFAAAPRLAAVTTPPCFAEAALVLGVCTFALCCETWAAVCAAGCAACCEAGIVVGA